MAAIIGRLQWDGTGAVRIDTARLTHSLPTWESPAGVRLRTRAVAALRQESAVPEERRRPIYEGVVSREQAARGAVVGQYVRMAHTPEENDSLAGGAGEPDQASTLVKRVLLGAMLLYMTGEDGEQGRGRFIREMV
jgi:hypothetical protein